MKRSTELILALLLLLWCVFMVGQHLKGREAMARKIAMDNFESEFFEAMAEADGLSQEAHKTSQEAFTWADTSTAGQETGS